MVRVLIAGCGYVGGQLAAQLARLPDHEVFALSRSTTLAVQGVRPICADMIKGDLSVLPSRLDKIFFCAAPSDSSVTAYEDIYVRALSRVIEFASLQGSPACRVLMTSSTSVYGQRSGELVTEESETLPESPASQQILRGEALLRAGDVAIRLGGIYGPGRTSFVAAVRDGTIRVNPAASAFTNRIHRDDAAGILDFCSRLDRPARIYNGVDCEQATRATVAAWIADQLGVALGTTAGAEESHFLRGNKRVSSQRLRDAGYKFLYPTFREGYKQLLAT